MTNAPEKIWAVADVDVSAQICDIYAQDTPDGFVDGPVEYIRADAIANHVKVKPLEWKAKPNKLVSGEYEIAWMTVGNCSVWRDEQLLSFALTSAEAKAIAQAHHEARIREALG